MRGDGPLLEGIGRSRFPFPPHARGWTAEAHEADGEQPVSPACAGMDLSPSGTRRSTRCFPRMRGDGPISEWDTALERFGPLSDDPRMRGDGPSGRVDRCNRPPFPPHARGWTQPGLMMACSMRLSFPRMRGDGPQDGQHRTLKLVSPACAGMDRGTTETRWCEYRFPRMRGDGPPVMSRRWIMSAFPPHARGWTSKGSAGVRSGVVSPACAGMDPRTTITRCCDASFPRMRGDGPSSGHAVARAHVVSPACAGMDPCCGCGLTPR